MAGRGRRRPQLIEHPDEGPFVSFTDLFIGILFLFLVLVAALMLMHQEAVQTDKAETLRMSGQVQQISGQSQRMQTRLDATAAKLQAKLDVATKSLDAANKSLDAAAKVAADHPAFRLGIVYNVFQAPPGPNRTWTFARTVQIYRSANGLCLENVILRNNLNLAWKPTTRPEDVPTAANQDLVRMGEPCTLSASEDHWNLVSETGHMERISPDAYFGYSVLHKPTGNEQVNIEYAILGIYDDYFRDSKDDAKS